jgi:hypothetical protein
MVALVAFGVIIALHYGWWPCHYRGDPAYWGWWPWSIIRDVRMPLFVLAVFYVGLSFTLGGKDAEPVPRRPRNWRRIIGVIFVLLVAAGTGAGMIYAYEVEKSKEATRQAKFEEEDSKHRITRSEIDLVDLQFEDASSYSRGCYYLFGRIRNRAAHNRTLNSITLMVTLRENAGSDILGQEKTAPIRVEVPSHQTRQFGTIICFPDLVYISQHAGWTYDVTEIRGSKGLSGGPWEDFAPAGGSEPTAPAVSPTPSPKP